MIVSLGSWATTVVCDEEKAYYRTATRLITMEFPGYKKSTDYKKPTEQKSCQATIGLYASAIHKFFLSAYCEEE